MRHHDTSRRRNVAQTACWIALRSSAMLGLLVPGIFQAQTSTGYRALPRGSTSGSTNVGEKNTEGAIAGDNPRLLPAALSAMPLAGDGDLNDQRRIAMPERQVDNGRRIALVIGESAYVTSPLRNPANDARGMAQLLTQLGFHVRMLIDVDRKTMNNEIRQFADRLAVDTAGTGLFYFAGHGIQASGVNYLIPIGSTIRREADLQDEAISAGFVLAQMQGSPTWTNLIILDACRNNPYAYSRGGAVGLATIAAPQGSLIAFATAPGRVANDGSGTHGTYTDALLRFMSLPGVQVEEFFKKVRVAVMGETGLDQIPTEETSLTHDFYFVADALSTVVAQTSDQVVFVPGNARGSGLIDERFASSRMLFTGDNAACSFSQTRGKYTLAGKTTNNACWSLYPTELPSRVRVEVGARSPDAAGRYSLLIGARAESFYNFVVTGDGEFYFEKYEKANWESLIPPTPAPSLRRSIDATNRLAVSIDGRLLTLAINGIQVGTYTAPSEVAGQVGFGVGPGKRVTYEYLRAAPVNTGKFAP